MKTILFKYFNLNLLLCLLIFTKVLSAPCSYVENAGEATKTTDANFLKDLSGDEAKQKCFSLSDSDVQDGKCCFDNNECVTDNTGDTTKECPVETNVDNNCGLAGIYQPLTSSTCTDISLVQGYCCFVKLKNNMGTSCIRTKELNKEKNTPTEQMSKYIFSFNHNYEIESVVCKGFNLKRYWLIFVFVAITLF